MQTVSTLCTPRENVFCDTVREDVLNLSDLIGGHVDAERFFNENFQTKGMTLLFDTAFRRFAGKSETGVVRLTQAMGGGKTHNMLALALLARDPDRRRAVLGDTYGDLGEIKVVAFSGRESDAEFGIWGSIAEQLGRKELFQDHYAPLRAPGESAWINLLQGEKVLILLDELPPYLENAKALAIGNSDLCAVTVTALSNLFTALGRAPLANVCLVFSDLRATYETGSRLLSSSFKELENEANRTALNLEPVALNTDEVYDILRKRLFRECPPAGASAVNDIAVEYKNSLVNAGKSSLTGYAGDAVFLGIKDSYPFHPSIKELYARFKENPGFQQTRGLIKLMRQVVRVFFTNGNADRKYLVNVFDVDLNESGMLSHIKRIKPSLEAAISHDIAQGGKAVAEVIDEQNDEKEEMYAQNVAKLLLMSSLNETPGGVLGLTESDILGYLCEPGKDLNSFKKALNDIVSQCWYLKTDNRGRIYFQNTKNMVAEMNTLVDSYSNENAKKELRRFLQTNFEPRWKKCYEQLYVLPAIDEIKVSQQKISLVVFEPYAGTGIHPDLRDFYDNCPYKNRVLFLSGSHNLVEKLYTNAKRLAAIRQILTGMKAEQVPESDQQYKEAEVLKDKATTALLQTIRETFVTLYYPSKGGLSREDFKLEFAANKFNGEDQIIKTLIEAMKFEDFKTESDFLETLRKKTEARIFTRKEMPWNGIQERAATEVSWQWYHPGQMDELKKKCLHSDAWREIGGYLTKGPFAKEPTDVTVEETDYDVTTGVFTLKIRPVRGDRVYYDVDAEPTRDSREVPRGPLTLSEPSAYFLCVDTAEENDPHPTGKAKKWIGRAPLLREQRRNADGRIVLELKSHKSYVIRYTTDGSNPKENGDVYRGEIVLPADCRFVQVAVSYKDDLVCEETITISAASEPVVMNKIDDAKPLEYVSNLMRKFIDTESAYGELAVLQQVPGTTISRFTIAITDKSSSDSYMEITAAGVPWDAGKLSETLEFVRDSAFVDRAIEISLEYQAIRFVSGAMFKLWVEKNRLDVSRLEKEGTVKQ